MDKVNKINPRINIINDLNINLSSLYVSPGLINKYNDSPTMGQIRTNVVIMLKLIVLSYNCVISPWTKGIWSSFSGFNQ